jgi:hypothetical protein
LHGETPLTQRLEVQRRAHVAVPATDPVLDLCHGHADACFSTRQPRQHLKNMNEVSPAHPLIVADLSVHIEDQQSMTVAAITATTSEPKQPSRKASDTVTGRGRPPSPVRRPAERNPESVRMPVRARGTMLERTVEELATCP